MTDTPEAPADILVVDGVKYKMTYGLLTDLQRVIPDPEQVVSPSTRSLSSNATSACRR